MQPQRTRISRVWDWCQARQGQSFHLSIRGHGSNSIMWIMWSFSFHNWARQTRLCFWKLRRCRLISGRPNLDSIPIDSSYIPFSIWITTLNILCGNCQAQKALNHEPIPGELSWPPTVAVEALCCVIKGWFMCVQCCNSFPSIFLTLILLIFEDSCLYHCRSHLLSHRSRRMGSLSMKWSHRLRRPN